MTQERNHVSPEALAAAWATWRKRHGGKLGPGPAFAEALAAGMAVDLAAAEAEGFRKGASWMACQIIDALPRAAMQSELRWDRYSLSQAIAVVRSIPVPDAVPASVTSLSAQLAAAREAGRLEGLEEAAVRVERLACKYKDTNDQVWLALRTLAVELMDEAAAIRAKMEGK